MLGCFACVQTAPPLSLSYATPPASDEAAPPPFSQHTTQHCFLLVDMRKKQAGEVSKLHFNSSLYFEIDICICMSVCCVCLCGMCSLVVRGR